jgi:aminopeptidase
MLQDPRVEKLADVLVNYSLGAQPGWQVAIQAGAAAAPLVAAVYRKTLDAGAFPVTLIALPELSDILLKHGSDEQVGRLSPFVAPMWDTSDAVLIIGADTNTRATSGVAPARMALAQQAARRASRFIEWASTGRPVCGTQFPTPAYAQDAAMSLDEYEAFYFHAGLVDTPDPVAAWRAMSATQQRVVDWLKGRRTAHVESPDIDLTLSIEGRGFQNADGHANFPDGEVFTSPVEDSVNGHIHFTYPASLRGREATGVRLAFKDGRVERAEAATGGDFLAGMLDIDAGARRLGEFAIGTNRGVDRFTRNVLFDEKMAGTIHCALGQSFPHLGGANQSALHWDMVADLRAGRITVDGETLYENGAFRL